MLAVPAALQLPLNIQIHKGPIGVSALDLFNLFDPRVIEKTDIDVQKPV
jgi:hypothetical protein